MHRSPAHKQWQLVVTTPGPPYKQRPNSLRSFSEGVSSRLLLTSSLRIGLVDDAGHIGMRTHLRACRNVTVSL
jgi:hypothetical protein